MFIIYATFHTDVYYFKGFIRIRINLNTLEMTNFVIVRKTK